MVGYIYGHKLIILKKQFYKEGFKLVVCFYMNYLCSKNISSFK